MTRQRLRRTLVHEKLPEQKINNKQIDRGNWFLKS